MRLLFLLLVLANIALFVWHDRLTAWIGPSRAEESTPVETDQIAPSLVLLGERRDRGPQVESEASAPAVTAEDRCVSVGPFIDQPSADETVQAAQASGLVADARQEERNVVVSNFLFLPERYPTTEAAEKAAAAVRAKGIEDVGAVAVGDQFAVSLGIYNRPRPLEKRRQQVEAAGYKTEVHERRAKRMVDIVVVHSDDAGIQALKERLATSDPQLEWQDTACP